MIIYNPNNSVFLGSDEDESGYGILLKKYISLRLQSPAFRGGVFLKEDGNLVKYEMWSSVQDYDFFMNEHKTFVRGLVSIYEEYCKTSGMRIEKQSQTVPRSELEDFQIEALNKRAFLSYSEKGSECTTIEN